MSRRPRHLSPDERDLWHRVAATAKPMTRRPAQAAAPEPAQTDPTPRKAPVARFEIGASHKAATVLPQTPAAPQAPKMDRKTFNRMKRGKLKPQARIDLHGMTQAVAHTALAGFVQRSSAEGLRLVLVITGKGKRSDDDGPIPVREGILRHQVPHWLELPPLRPLVLDVVQAHASHGGGGAYYIYLRRRR